MAWWHPLIVFAASKAGKALQDRAPKDRALSRSPREAEKDKRHKQELKRRASEAKAKWHEHKLKNNPRYREAHEKQREKD